MGQGIGMQALYFLKPSNPVLNIFVNSGYVLSLIIAIVTAFVASFFVSRLWCDNICPIGGFARIYLWVLRKWGNRWVKIIIIAAIIVAVVSLQAF